MIKIRNVAGTLLLAALSFVSMQAWAQTPLLLLDFELVEEMHDPRTAEGDRNRLILVNEELAKQMNSCAAFRIVDGAPVQDSIDISRSRIAYLHRCNGCAADIGSAANVQFVLFPWVQKVSNLILNLNAEIRETATDRVVAARSVDIRGNTDRSWLRGARALGIRLCELDGKRLSREPAQ